MTSESKSKKTLYVIEYVYNPETKKSSSKTVERLGSEKEIREKHNVKDAIEWANNYAIELTKKTKKTSSKVPLSLYSNRRVLKGDERVFNGGYLFLQKIYYELGLNKISNDIGRKYKFSYDLNAVLSNLIYARILNPSSKLSTNEYIKRLIDSKDVSLQHIYRALDVIADENYFIQSRLYKNSKDVIRRNDLILYYDCSNFYFEIENEDGLKQYGLGKDHKPNPIVQMGLFMDANGIPLAFSINRGNTNEQKTLIPLEKKILSDFNHSKFVVCTDSGLSSVANRRFNNVGNRRFITTQSVKGLKKYLKEWAVNPNGWHVAGSNKTFNLNNLNIDKDYEKIFYKERWINDDNIEQRILVTFSIKYLIYQRGIREKQVNRAIKAIERNPKKPIKFSQNDYKRFIKLTNVTKDGEVAKGSNISVNSNLVDKESIYDGFYAIATNLEGSVSDLVRVNKRRWEIERCFRVMKNELRARPVYLQKDNRIEAHFLTCFISLIVCRIIEKRLNNKFSIEKIIKTLSSMNFILSKGEGYQNAYNRNDVTDAIHKAFGFYTDFEIITNSDMRKIIHKTKHKNNAQKH
jgi:transposase